MINATNTTPTTLTQTDNPYVNPNGILGKDDFMKLLLIELQYQDPTDPMDTEKILSQTSELATLESTDNTNKTLEKLSNTLAATQQFSVIGAIGKTASLGKDTIQHTKDETTTFEIYFPDDIKSGTIDITDLDGNVIKTFPIGTNPQGVYSFDWDGTNSNGEKVDSGIYHVRSHYENSNGIEKETAIGVYPIESVRFDSGNALLKLGSSYVPMDQIVEIY